MLFHLIGIIRNETTFDSSVFGLHHRCFFLFPNILDLFHWRRFLCLNERVAGIQQCFKINNKMILLTCFVEPQCILVFRHLFHFERIGKETIQRLLLQVTIQVTSSIYVCVGFGANPFIFSSWSIRNVNSFAWMAKPKNQKNKKSHSLCSAWHCESITGKSFIQFEECICWKWIFFGFSKRSDQTEWLRLWSWISRDITDSLIDTKSNLYGKKGIASIWKTKSENGFNIWVIWFCFSEIGFHWSQTMMYLYKTLKMHGCMDMMDKVDAFEMLMASRKGTKKNNKIQN